MRHFLVGAGLLFALAWATPAHAQYANHSIGFSVGYLKVNDNAGLDWAIPFGITYTAYIDGGLDAVVHAQGAITQEPFSTRQDFAIFPSIGLRYRLMSEAFRPYVGLDLVYLHVFSDTLADLTNWVGLGPNVGFEYFPADSWSIGLRGQFNAYWWLSKSIDTGFGVTAEVNFYY